MKYSLIYYIADENNLKTNRLLKSILNYLPKLYQNLVLFPCWKCHFSLLATVRILMHALRMYSFITQKILNFLQILYANSNPLINAWQTYGEITSWSSLELIRMWSAYSNLSSLPPQKNENLYASLTGYPGVGGRGLLGLISAGYVPLASQSPYPIIVYSVADCIPHLSHFWAITTFKLNEEHFTFHSQYKHSGMFANHKYEELSYPKNKKCAITF